MADQNGNNNTYCQDNELTWLDWRVGDESAQMLRFVQKLAALRRRHPAVMRPTFVDPFAAPDDPDAGISWHGVRQGRPDWDVHSHTLAMQVHGCPAMDGTDDLYLVVNAWREPLSFELPSTPPTRRWHRLVDTALPSPEEIVDHADAPPHHQDRYRVEPNSAVLLVAIPGR